MYMNIQWNAWTAAKGREVLYNSTLIYKSFKNNPDLYRELLIVDFTYKLKEKGERFPVYCKWLHSKVNVFFISANNCLAIKG